MPGQNGRRRRLVSPVVDIQMINHAAIVSPGQAPAVPPASAGDERKFRPASWDVWDPSLYGNQLKFVKIITNSGARVSLEPGMCYEAAVVKHVDSPDEYVCLDSARPMRRNFRVTAYESMR